MRRFNVHLVTEIDFVDGDEASDEAAQNYQKHLSGHPSERGARDLASDDQRRPGRERLGRRNQGRTLMRGFERMTLANMRLHGVRSVIAACANCGRSTDVNVDQLPRP